MTSNPMTSLGVDFTHTGLFCRGDPLCHERFVGDIPVAAAARNAHEVEAHDHHHVDEEPGWAPSFHQGMTKRGRSLLGRRKK